MTKEQYLSNDAFQEIFQKAKSNSGINLMLNFFIKRLEILTHLASIIIFLQL